MKILAFSDIHRNDDATKQVVEKARAADLVIGSGDYCSQHNGLSETIKILKRIETKTLLVPGNNETPDELRDAVDGWEAATVLHGDSFEFQGMKFFGLGGGTTEATAGDWSFELTEDEFTENLSKCDSGSILILHCPPYGYLDSTGDKHLGSKSIAQFATQKQPPLIFCGHVHDHSGREKPLGTTRVINPGPNGLLMNADRLT